LLLASLPGGCDQVEVEPGPAVLELPGSTVELAGGARIVDIEIRDDNGPRFEPADIDIAVGDMVRFRVGGRGPHALVFEPDSSAAAIREFLDRTGQMRSAPLIEPGVAWILTFEGAPPGEYPFRCLTHGERGRIVVAPGA